MMEKFLVSSTDMGGMGQEGDGNPAPVEIGRIGGIEKRETMSAPLVAKVSSR
jgi:hypothetical protein